MSFFLQSFHFFFFLFVSLAHSSFSPFQKSPKTIQGVRQGRDLPASREAPPGGRPEAREEGRRLARLFLFFLFRPGDGTPAPSVQDRDRPGMERRALRPRRRRVPGGPPDLPPLDQGLYRAQGRGLGPVEDRPVPVARGRVARGPSLRWEEREGKSNGARFRVNKQEHQQIIRLLVLMVGF